MFGEHLIPPGLLGKESRRIAEGFELECVARSVVEKKSCLLAHFAGKADSRFYDEVDTRRLEAIGE